MRRAIITDIDATISNCSHRIHNIKNGNRNWNAFFDLIGDDEPIPYTISLIEAWYKSGKPVIALTGRPEKYRSATEAWIAKHAPFIEKVYMRADNDFRSGPVTKLAEIERIKADGYEPVLLLDDHPGIVKFFRENGIPAFHVTDQGEEGDVPARTWNGETFLTVVIGPSGAGKSTFCSKFPGSWVVSSDEIREQKTKWDRTDPNNETTWAEITPEEHARVWRAFHALVKVRLDNGLPTIADATNIKAKDRKAILDMVPKGQRVRYVIIDRPLETKIRDRGWRSENLIRRMHESFNSGARHALNGDGFDFVDVEDHRVVTKSQVNNR